MPLKNRNNHYLTPISGFFIAASLLLTGCANGADAPTRMIKQVTDGVEVDQGSIKVRNLTLVAQEDGSGVFIGTFINTGAQNDAIVSITANEIAAEINPTNPVLETNAPVTFAGDIANASGRVPGLNVEAGKRVPVTITFASQEVINADVLVVLKEGDYANVGN
ncbi:unannotated protein [freshwater metagenome]|uniref:Unannotated protein n=1 Tax=freshwater metagenome TaxID=449393 RepID=A0A6J6BDC1_9ZZZZ|nr:hypothetical protein [Actinomycetota bacterium]